MSATKYPKYYKNVTHLTEVDVYQIHHLFNIQDPSGAIQHASKKLLLSGVRTGGKTKYQDIKEARDTLNRWLEINEQGVTDADEKIQLTDGATLLAPVVRDTHTGSA